MKYAIILLLVALTGCTAPITVIDQPKETIPLPVPIPPPVPSPVSVMASTPSPAEIVVTGSSNIVLVKDMLFSDQATPKQTMSFILLPKRPTTKALQEKYEQICSEWSYSFYTQVQTKELPDNIKRVPFYWFSSSQTKNVKRYNSKCSDLVEQYDYARAHSLARSLNLNVTKIYIVLTHKTTIVTLDMSDLSKESDISLALDTWKEKMMVLPQKSTTLTITNLFYSTKIVLGALGNLLTLK